MKPTTISSLIFLFLLEAVTSYKVLVFNPAFGASHSNFLGKISDILIDAGHEVTMLIPISMESKKDLIGSKKVKKVIRIDQEPRSRKMQEEAKTEDMIKKQIWKLDADITIFVSMIKNFSLASGYQCEHIFQQTAILEELKNEHFDLGITESLFICGFPLLDHIGVKTVINADSVLYLDVVKYALGEPASTSFYPGVFSRNIDKMSFSERTRNLFGMAFSWYFSWTRFQGELEAIKPYYKKSLTWEEHINGAAFYLINSNRYLDYASPTLPKTVFIGGMQVNTKKNGKVQLDREWDDLLNIRKQNVLVSFGSNAFSCNMPDEFKKSFLEVFASMPDVTFIWKYEEENATLADHLPNVKLTTWMPQNDLLADDRLTLFVTHGGLGSSIELAYQGKPAVVIPLMADQPRNAHMLTRHGGAFQLDKSQLDKPEVIRNAIQTVMNDDNYKRNSEKLAEILSSQPYQPKDVVLKHCDFAVKFGDLKTLNSEGRNLNVFQYYSIDIAVAAISLILTVLVVIVLVFSCIFRKCSRSFFNGKIFDLSSAYKVLVFNPAFGASHSNFLGKISDILINAGHEVTMLIPISMQSKKHLVGSKKVKKIIRIDQDPRSVELYKESGAEDVLRNKIWKIDSDMMVFFQMASNFSKNCGYQSSDVFQQTEILEKLKNEKFDLGITESLFICGYPLFDHLGIKTVINADSVLFMDIVKNILGEPASSTFYPALISPMTDKMSLMERIKNMIQMLVPMYFSKMRFDEELKMIKPYYNGTNTWREHLEGVAFNMVNSNRYLDYASPTLPKTVFIGGMQVNTKKNGKVQLDKEWDNLLNIRKQNVLVSFGSNAFSCDMPDEFKKSFLEAALTDWFASMPDVTFIWKYEEENATLADHLPNVKLTTWMPQNDLLADDRLTLFVTHGGLGSSIELAYQGKPAVVIPLMADQPRNAHMLTRHGGAVQLDKNNLANSDLIRNAIKLILENTSYKKNSEKLAKILEEQPYSPAEVVLKHCDFAVKFGALETLQSEGRNLNLLQFYSYDIFVVFCLCLVFVLTFMILIVKSTVKFCRKSGNIKLKNE
ncbi:CRE-UGT-15 protein [Caenorhabditis remanei]|uniref:glucuronosyltransferase n=1 Tax=Caenorhabditis remanei TaxID=31234 RepID=E3LNV0_CAERE|nr:CRE-UGT-15 protein [Caenorhabditis remanei]